MVGCCCSTLSILNQLCPSCRVHQLMLTMASYTLYKHNTFQLVHPFFYLKMNFGSWRGVYSRSTIGRSVHLNCTALLGDRPKPDGGTPPKRQMLLKLINAINDKSFTSQNVRCGTVFRKEANDDPGVFLILICWTSSLVDFGKKGKVWQT